MIVIGGTFAATLIKFPISTCVSALVEGSKAVFVDRKEDSVSHPVPWTQVCLRGGPE